jgi:hypothetical protein
MVARRQVVEGESGEQCRLEPHVPTWGMVLEFVVKASTGHPSTPKGGSPEYRNGPWYKTICGKRLSLSPFTQMKKALHRRRIEF